MAMSTLPLTKDARPADGELPVLSGIDLQVRAGEVLALLGKSGSGKSTLLRCLAGLVPASSGTVTYKNTPLTGANPGTAMVFQTFALLPWLTVQQNVELGLEAKGVGATEHWGRYAELYSYDAEPQEYRLDENDETAAALRP